MIEIQPQLGGLLACIDEAGEAIMAVYESGDMQIRTKEDDSPLTRADLDANRIIMAGLSRLFNGVPIVSEEADDAKNRRITSDEGTYWLVDPLDGTKEFIKKTGEFTVCVALIEDNVPTFGVVSAPALGGTTYYGGSQVGNESFKISRESASPHKITTRKNNPPVLLRSVSFLNDATKSLICRDYAGHRITPLGSQLKLTAIAEGAADVYPRAESPLHTWDLAAGHAILDSAGGTITRLDGSQLDYTTQTLGIPDFIARNQ